MGMGKKEYRSGKTGEFDLDELALSDEELEVLKKRRREEHLESATADDWNDPWGGGGGGGDVWAADRKWHGDEPEAPARKAQGTVSLDLNELRAKSDTAALDDGGTADGWDDWDNNWDSGGAAGVGGGGEQQFGWTEGTGAIDLNEVREVIGHTKGVRDEERAGGGKRNQAARAYDAPSDSNYVAGKFLGSERKAKSHYEGSEVGYGGGGFNAQNRRSKSSEDYQQDGRVQDYDVDQMRMRADAEEILDDDGWSSGKVIDERSRNVPVMPASVPGGGEATAAIDLDAFYGSSSDAPEPGAPAGGAPAGARPDNLATASLVIFAPNSEPVVYELQRDMVSIGRELANNIVLTDPYASRKHVLIRRRGPNFEVQDAGSDNGTTVNGFPMAHALLMPGDHIEIGSTVLRFVVGPPRPQDRVLMNPPGRPPHHLAPPPAVARQGMSTGTIIAIFVVLLLLIVVGVVAAVFLLL